jgi:hypothetical protein
MAQWVGCLLCKYKAPSSNPSLIWKKKKKARCSGAHLFAVTTAWSQPVHKHKILSVKAKKKKRWGMVQVVEYLSSKLKALSLYPNASQKEMVFLRRPGALNSWSFTSFVLRQGLTVELKMAWNLKSTYLSLSSAEITGLHHEHSLTGINLSNLEIWRAFCGQVYLLTTS